jgi:hypothetical protein
MKKLKTVEEIQEVLLNEELHHPETTLSHLMNNKIYKCGCGNSHAVDKAIVGAACRGRSIAHSGVGKGFILVCNTHATLVVTEGIFNYTFKSIWTFDKSLMPGGLYY